MVTGQEQEKPDRNQESEALEKVEEIPEVPEIPKYIEQAGVVATPTQVTTQVSSDSGKPLVQSPATQVVTITIPASQEQLEDWSKGSPTESITWFAFYWLRMIKKALHFGWKVITRQERI